MNRFNKALSTSKRIWAPWRFTEHGLSDGRWGRKSKNFYIGYVQDPKVGREIIKIIWFFDQGSKAYFINGFTEVD